MYSSLVCCSLGLLIWVFKGWWCFVRKLAASRLDDIKQTSSSTIKIADGHVIFTVAVTAASVSETMMIKVNRRKWEPP